MVSLAKKMFGLSGSGVGEHYCVSRKSASCFEFSVYKTFPSFRPLNQPDGYVCHVAALFCILLYVVVLILHVILRLAQNSHTAMEIWYFF